MNLICETKTELWKKNIEKNVLCHVLFECCLVQKRFSLDKMCYDLNVDYPSDWRTESEKNVQKRTNSDNVFPCGT